MDNGWIKIHRKLTESNGYFQDVFCRNMAWIDLLLLANHRDNYYRIRGIKVEVKRGQIGHSIDSIRNRWKWSKGKVLRFLNELETSNQIVQQKTNVITLISIVNYDIYQSHSTTNSTTNSTTDGLQTVQQTDTNKNVKNIKNDKNERIIQAFAKPTLENVKEYFLSKNQNEDQAERFFNYYESNGWMVSKVKMKNWKAASNNWIKRIEEYDTNKTGISQLSKREREQQIWENLGSSITGGK